MALAAFSFCTKNTRASPFSFSLYKFMFSTERARWSVIESMRQDRRALSCGNIIILYGHVYHARKPRIRAKALWRKEEEVGNGVGVPQWTAGGFPSVVCQTIGGSIWLRWKQRAIIDRSFMRLSGKMRAPPWREPPSIERPFRANRYRLFNDITNHRSTCWLIGNTCFVAIAENIDTCVWRGHFKSMRPFIA